MTEKSLLLKCDFADHYFMLGTDFPVARIFDTTTSRLVTVVELPLRSGTVSLTARTLTSLSIRQAEEETAAEASSGKGSALARHRSEALLDDKVTTYYAGVGLSDGTVILHDVRRDIQLAHVQVSETQQPIISLQICGGYVFCLAGDHILHVMQVQNAAGGPCLRLRVQPDASAIAVTTLAAVDSAEATADPTTARVNVLHRVFRVLVSGPTNALYEMRSLANGNSSGAAACSATTNTTGTLQLHATKLLAFPSQGTSAEFAWVSSAAPPALSAAAPGGVSDTPFSLPAITASAQEGVVRIWDAQYTPSSASAAAFLLSAGLDSAAASSAAVVARCRRTLLCGQRILNVSVLPDTTDSTRKGNYIMVTTLTGSVLLWSLGGALLPPVVEPVPLKPDVVLVSAVAAGRLLFGALRPASGAPNRTASLDNPLCSLEMTLLRGRFALPMFEAMNIGDAVDQASSAAAAAPPKSVGVTDAGAGAKPKARAANVSATNARRTALATLALGLAGSDASAVTVVELPLSSMHASLLEDQRDAEYLLQSTTDAATSAFVVMDTVWATHQQQVAAKASQYMTDAFKAPHLYHAKSIQDLPVKQYTLEQRLQQVVREEAAAAVRRRRLAISGAPVAEGVSDADDALEQSQDGTKSSRWVLSHHTLGLATVPLYQALHANDTSAVMDLLNVSARSAEGMRATVLSLQLPYCLQLLHVISERLGMCSKAVERVAPELKTGPGDSAESTSADATGEKKGRTADTPRGGSKIDAATSPADAHAGSGSDVALRGGVAAFSIRSSLLEWIDAIVHYRGSELLALQRDWDARQAAGQPCEATSSMAVSPPKDFLAPILHHYESLCSQYDKLALLYGRLSIFKSVRPSQKNDFVNIPRKSLASNVEMGRPVPAVKDDLIASGGPSKRRLHLAGRSSVVDDDIIFPVMFKESRSRSGLRVVRVRSKLEIAKKRRQRESKDAALQKHARALAQEQLRSANAARSILDDDSDMKRGGGLDVMDQVMMTEMESEDGEVRLDALEAMNLADDASDADMLSDGSFDGEEEEEDEDSSEEEAAEDFTTARSKKARRETVVTEEMLADAEGESDDDQDKDDDAALDSSEAEFSSGSDDEVDTDSPDGEDESEEKDESSDDVQDSDVDERLEDRDDDETSASDELADDDGMGDEMQELLALHENDEDRSERRKAKKVRTD